VVAAFLVAAMSGRLTNPIGPTGIMAALIALTHTNYGANVSKRRRSKSKDYLVGYGRPPKATQFQPEQSGNPRGRPKGSRSVDVILQGISNQKMTIAEQGRTQRVSKLEVMLLQLANHATRGDLRALKLYLEFIDRYCRQAGGPDRSEEITSEDLEILADYLQKIEPPNADPNKKSPKEGGVDDGESL
jgi:hypothetical protein